MTQYREHTSLNGEIRRQCVECRAFNGEHRSICSSVRPFPISRGGEVPWWLAEVAYEYYNKRWPGQTLETLSERGGFGVTEFVSLIRQSLGTYHSPSSSEA